MERAVESGGDTFRNFIFEFGQASDVQIAFAAERGGVRMGVKHFEREAPLAFGFLNGAVNDKARAEICGDCGGGHFAGDI